VRKKIQVHQKYSTFLYKKPPKEMLKSPGKTLSGRGSEPVSDKLLVVIAIYFWWRAPIFVGLGYQGKDIVFRFIIEYSSLMDFGH
jgi:hypothetical protein